MGYWRICDKEPPHRIDSWDDVLGSCGVRATGHECQWLGPDVFVVPVGEGTIIIEDREAAAERMRVLLREWDEAGEFPMPTGFNDTAHMLLAAAAGEKP